MTKTHPKWYGREMFFTTEKDIFLEALQRVLSVIDKKNTFPILGNVLLQIVDCQLFISGTDLELSVRTNFPLTESSLSGSITVPGKSLTDIVRELPKLPIKIEVNQNDWLHLTCGNTKFAVLGLPAHQYPVLPHYTSKTYYPILKDALLDALNLTSFCTSIDNALVLLNGTCFKILDHSVELTASDTHRLAYVQRILFVEQVPSTHSCMILPNKGLSEMSRMLEKTDGSEKIAVSYEPGYFFLSTQGTCQDTYLSIRTLEGEYPDYQSIIASTYAFSVVLDKVAFVSAIRRMSLLLTEKIRAIKLSFTENTLVVSSVNFEVGEGFEQIELVYEHEPYEVSFKARHLLDYLNQLTCGDIRLHLRGPNHTAMIEPIGLHPSLSPLLKDVYIMMPITMN